MDFSITYVFSIALLLYANLVFALALSLLLNLYVFNKFRNKFKSFYFYFCNLIGLLLTVGITILITKTLTVNWIVVVLEVMLLFGTTIFSNRYFVNLLYERNKLSDNQVPRLINKNVGFIFIINIVTWSIYVISVVVNLLKRVQLICIANPDLNYILEVSEGMVIILLAIESLIGVINKGLKLKKEIKSKK